MIITTQLRTVIGLTVLATSHGNMLVMIEVEDQHCRILLLFKEVWCPYTVEEQAKIKECCMCIYHFTALSKSLPLNLHLIYALLHMCTLNHRALWCHISNYIATKFCLSKSLGSTQFHNIKTLFHNWFIPLSFYSQGQSYFIIRHFLTLSP